MTNNDILISGAGIGGPALAFWLRKAGFNPTIVERAPAPRPGGQAVDLRGAGRTVIERMGLMEQARAVTLEQHGMAWVDTDDQVKATMPVDAFGGEGIISEIEILRGDLGDLLYEASLPGTEYLFDDTITTIEQDDDGVLVTFENSPPRRFGLVVGADGLHSTVRKLAFGPEEQFVRPIGCYTAWFTSADTGMDLDGWYRMHNAPGGRVASARPGRLPGEVKVGLSFRTDDLDYDRRDNVAIHDLIEERFQGVGWHAPQLLAAMRRSPDFVFDSMGQVHMERWSTGRVALIGDAACCPTPLTGLGTSLALVGAYVLAGELAAAGGDHEAAFERYEQVMRPYAKTCQELPPNGVAGFAPMSKLAIALGRLSMRMMTRWPIRPLLAKQFAKAGGIELPDYSWPASSAAAASAVTLAAPSATT